MHNLRWLNNMNRQNLILPVSILLGAVIMGGFYFAIETSKQKIAKERIVYEQRQQEKLKECFDNVEKEYIEIAKLNGYEVKDDKFIKMSDDVRIRMNERKQLKLDKCIKLYK